MPASTSPTHSPVSVPGLEHGRAHARRQARRRRAANRVASILVFAVIAGGLGTAGYYLWQFYADEQREATDDTPAPDTDPSTVELIEQLEDTPRWNGPGAPAFGVGDDQP